MATQKKSKLSTVSPETVSPGTNPFSKTPPSLDNKAAFPQASKRTVGANLPPKKKGGMTSGNSAKSGINSYLKKGGKVKSKMMYGGMKKGGTKKGM